MAMNIKYHFGSKHIFVTKDNIIVHLVSRPNLYKKEKTTNSWHLQYFTTFELYYLFYYPLYAGHVLSYIFRQQTQTMLYNKQ